MITCLLYEHFASIRVFLECIPEVVFCQGEQIAVTLWSHVCRTSIPVFTAGNVQNTQLTEYGAWTLSHIGLVFVYLVSDQYKHVSAVST